MAERRRSATIGSFFPTDSRAMAHDKLAVLIDADNARPAIVEGLLAEIAKYGTAHVKRIYGDWTKPDLNGWKEALLRYSIQPIQQFRYTVGKNATDSAMIIDAMDLLYAERFDGFCIVSSDSDFTRLAHPRIRAHRLRFRREEDAGAVPHRLRQIHLYRGAGWHQRDRNRDGTETALGEGTARRQQIDEHAAQCDRGRVRRDRLGQPRAGRQHHQQAVARLRLAQLWLRKTERPDQGHRPVRHRGAPDRQRQAHLRAVPRRQEMSDPLQAHLLAALTATAPAPICVAFSGGPDSSALLHALAREPLARERGLRAAHVDHGLHADSARWAAHCARFCQDLDVPCALVRVDVPRDGGKGLEAAARHVRHAALADLLHDGEWLLFGHHRDDQVETVLLKLLRGAGPEGLGGMRVRRPFGAGQLWRPMLELPRATLLDYVAAHQLDSIDDPSNADIRLARNRLRHEILTGLLRYWPQACDSILPTAPLSRHAADALRSQRPPGSDSLPDRAGGTPTLPARRGLRPACPD